MLLLSLYCCLLTSHLCAYFTCWSVHPSTLRPVLSHHHLCYVNDFYYNYVLRVPTKFWK